nr:unnamed protein product [Callosobruchus analis]
MCCLGQRNMP